MQDQAVVGVAPGAGAADPLGDIDDALVIAAALQDVGEDLAVPIGAAGAFRAHSRGGLDQRRVVADREGADRRAHQLLAGDLAELKRAVEEVEHPAIMAERGDRKAARQAPAAAGRRRRLVGVALDRRRGQRRVVHQRSDDAQRDDPVIRHGGPGR